MMLAVMGALFAFMVSIGTGGGMLLIPFLTMCLGYSMAQAQHTVLLLYIPISVFATALNIKRGLLGTDMRGTMEYIAVGLAGVAVGWLASGCADGTALRVIYASFITAAGLSQLPSVLRPDK